MIRKISKKMTDRLLLRNAIQENECELYQYGLEQLFLSCMNMLTVIVMTCFMKMNWEIWLFIGAFILLRKYAGGFHASTPLRCYLLTNMVILSSFSVMKYMNIHIFIYLGLFVVSSIILFILAPVEASNCPLDGIEKIVYRRKTILIWSIEAFLAILALILKQHQISTSLFMATMVLSVSLGAGWWQCRRMREGKYTRIV